MSAGAATPGSAWGRSPLAAIGLGLVLTATLSKLSGAYDPFPFWGTDPFQISTPATGITPLMSLLLDLVTLLGAALITATRGVRWPELALWAAGSAVALVHASRGPLDHLITGSTWMSALAAGLAIRAIAADARLAGFTAAALLGAVMLLVTKGALQVLIEHPDTVRAYRDNRAAFLAAQGWTEGSAMARAFERRLYQPEATGWFGLSNVYASVMAGSLITLAGLTLAAWRRRESLTAASRLILALATGLAAAGLAMSRSKGGVGATLVGGAVLGLLILRPGFLAKRPKFGPALALAVPALTLAAVAIRGLLGERLGELSLYFRWFYLQGAARIYAQEPLLGVGPAGFKDAYLLAKPPLSPEEVTSPHSLLFDYAATLGLGGLAWATLVLLWVGFVGKTAAAAEDAPGAGPVSRDQVRALALIAALVMLFSAWIEQPATTLEAMLARLLGAGLWITVGLALLRLWSTAGGPARAAALAAGALALVAHAQIEVTPVWPGGAAWVMMMLALATGGNHPPPIRSGMLGAALLASAALALGISIPAVARWEQSLKSSAASAQAAAELREQAARLREAGPGERAALASELSRLLARPVPTDPPTLHAASEEAILVCIDAAQSDLAAAAALQPAHFPTTRALSRARLEMALSLEQAGRAEEARSSQLAAEQDIERFLAAHPRLSTPWAWLGTLRAGPGPADPDRLRRACDAWERAAGLDPYSLEYAPELARAYRTLGEAEKARDWARAALRNNDLHRLDPLQQLREDEVRDLRAITGG